MSEEKKVQDGVKNENLEDVEDVLENLKPAKAVKEKSEPKNSKVLEILRKEYPFENWILAILAPLLSLIGVYILDGQVVTVDKTDWWIFNSDLKIKIIAWVLIAIGVAVILFLLIPYLMPSFKEMKKVSWPTPKKLVGDSLRVFGFVLLFALLFTLYEVILNPIINLLIG